MNRRLRKEMEVPRAEGNNANDWSFLKEAKTNAVRVSMAALVSVFGWWITTTRTEVANLKDQMATVRMLMFTKEEKDKLNEAVLRSAMALEDLARLPQIMEDQNKRVYALERELAVIKAARNGE